MAVAFLNNFRSTILVGLDNGDSNDLIEFLQKEDGCVSLDWIEFIEDHQLRNGCRLSAYCSNAADMPELAVKLRDNGFDVRSFVVGDVLYKFEDE